MDDLPGSSSASWGEATLKAVCFSEANVPFSARRVYGQPRTKSAYKLRAFQILFLFLFFSVSGEIFFGLKRIYVSRHMPKCGAVF